MVTLSYPSKIDAAVAVVGEVSEVGKPLLTGVGFEVSLLIQDAVRLPLELIVSREPFVQSCDF